MTGRLVRRWPLRALTAALGAAGLAGAAGCASPEELLDVRVGQSSRGSVVVRIERNEDRVSDLLLPPDVLRTGEQVYVAGRVDCDGVAFVRLLPELRVTYRTETQELRITPVLARLGERRIDVGQMLTPPVYPVVPAFGLDFGVQGAVSYDLRGERAAGTPATTLGNVGAYVGVGGARGGLTGYVGALYGRRPGSDAKVQVRATAQYAFSPSVAIYVAYHAIPGVAQPGFSTSSFSGVTAAYRQQVPAVASPISVQLENPSVVSVLVNGQLLGSVEAPAGEITLLNVPLPRQANNTVALLIEDENGLTQRTFNGVSPSEASLTGGLFASASVGYDDQSVGSGWSAAATAAYTFRPQLGVEAQASVSGNGALSAAAQVRYLGAPLSGGLGIQVSRPATAADMATSPLSTRVNGSLAYRQGPLSVNGSVAVPINELSSSTLNLSAAYSAAPWYFSAAAATGLTAQSWQVDGSVTRILNERSAVGLTASVRPGGWQAALRGNYVFTPKLQGSASIGLGSGGTVPSTTLSYRPDPTQLVGLSADLNEIGVTYSLSRGVDASASATTRGATAQITGAVAYLDGRLLLSSGLAQRGILVRTGVPNLPLLVDGLGGVVTNQRGDALITQAAPTQTVSIRVNPRELPLGVSLQSVETTVQPAATGLTVVDWHDNFRISTFVQFRWQAGEVAANADVYLDGEKILLDDEGYGLVSQAAVTRTGELRDPVGSRRCTVVLASTVKEATCFVVPGSP
ncbi:hypothetical protein GCM10010841_27310 [Deinococcus aerophilus]|uniref:Fimbrial biogenesis outer membrane usher protein n=1 Tax=Deinococcus aerophilus TaxID=522488 RepID=A0ABQ2GYP9_9DEIO|nr:hypothetical protein GCM10010841_27310 [Deinococcus aerophilus]